LKMHINFEKLLFPLFAIWLIISSFYYIGNFIDGEVTSERPERVFQQIFKYLAAIFFSGSFFLLHKKTSLLIQYTVLVFALFIMSICWLYGYNTIPAIHVLIVLFSFIGLIYATSSFKEEQIVILAKVVVFSACIAAAISYFEYYFMEPVLGDYWNNTGGFRSVSTFLNPNNSGLFFGAALILIFFNNKFYPLIKFVICPIIFGALLLSGSRTAWISLVVAFSLGVLYRGRGKIDALNLFKLTILILFLVAVFSALYSMNLLYLPERMTDMYTAALRLEKYFEYVAGVDSAYLFPDFDLLRIDIVSESAYFHFVNALGGMWFVVIIVSWLSFVRLAWLVNLFSTSPYRCFDIVVFYYFFAMLFENVLMSFPNNQLLFVSLGIAVMNTRNGLVGKLNYSQLNFSRGLKE